MRFSKVERENVFAKTKGTCFHCDCVITIEDFDIDHFPVRKADIEDQCCLCGISDPRDINNLVSSCKTCNRSHKFESTKYCGHSQLRVRKSFITRGLVLALFTTGAYLAGHYIR